MAKKPNTLLGRINQLLARALEAKKPPPKKSASWWRKLAYHHPAEWADILEVIHEFDNDNSPDGLRTLYYGYEDLWERGGIKEVVLKLTGKPLSAEHFANSVRAIKVEYPCKTKS